MNRLYIIGNGFDLYHKLDTSYKSFGLYLKKNYTETYEKLIDYFGFPTISDDGCSMDDEVMWNQFEKNLSLLDSEMVLDSYIHSVAHPFSEGFKDRDWNTFAINIEMFVDNLVSDLFKAFKEFICKRSL